MWEELEIMDRIKIKDLLLSPKLDQNILVMGWVRTFRSNRFIALNDGSGLSNLQVVVDFEAMDPELLKRITVGASIRAIGTLTPSQGSGQATQLSGMYNYSSSLFRISASLIGKVLKPSIL